MILKINLKHILFLDIETVPEFQNFEELSENKQKLFADKTEYQRDDISAKEFYNRAGIWAEFGKIVCISVGFFTLKDDNRNFRTTSFSGDEADLLKKFKILLEDYFSLPQHLLCGHNAKEFDFPYIARRMLIHGIALPEKLQLFGKKPWEIPHLDTLELWKFGDYKHYTSLKLLTEIFDIPSPKDDIDGSQVREVFYEDKDIDRIVTYCEKDVVAVAQLILKMRQEPLLKNEEIISV
ncbi:MAG: 3'-5' exonuclease [Psychroflexus sp.]